jgi:hypothetical protein
MPEICLVSSDYQKQSNSIYVIPNDTVNVKDYRFYADSVLIYSLSAKYIYNELIVFNDTSSARIDTITSYRLSFTDDCGLETPLSVAHNNINLQYEKTSDTTVSLTWNEYNGRDAESYDVYRGYNPVNLTQIASVNSIYFTDNDLVDGTLFYRIVAKLNKKNSDISGIQDESFDHSYSNIVSVNNQYALPVYFLNWHETFFSDLILLSPELTVCMSDSILLDTLFSTLTEEPLEITWMIKLNNEVVPANAGKLLITGDTLLFLSALEDNGCSYVDTILIRSTNCSTGITSVSSKTNDIKIYPNPSKGEFTVEFKGNQARDFEITVWDILGRKILTRLYKSHPEINDRLTMNVPAGCYYIIISDKQQVWYCPLIIN